MPTFAHALLVLAPQSVSAIAPWDERIGDLLVQR